MSLPFVTACAIASLCASLALLAARAARAADDVVAPPAGFGVRPAGALEAVVHAEVVAHAPGSVDRASIEAQCETARTLGLTARQPTFEPGHAAPTRTETLRYGNPRHQADFVTRHIVECAAPPRTTNAADVLCGCTYRLHVHRSVRTYRRDGTTADPARELARVRRLMPEVLRADTIAGVPCLWRRLRLPDDARIERCIVEADDATVPPFLRGSALAESTSRAGGEAVQTSRTTRLLLRARVDAGVFAAPEGDVPQEPAR